MAPLKDSGARPHAAMASVSTLLSLVLGTLQGEDQCGPGGTEHGLAPQTERGVGAGEVGRGFRHEGEWLVDNKCDTASRLSQVNEGGGGCRPVPLRHRLDGSQLVLAESDILQGWRLFS